MDQPAAAGGLRDPRGLDERGGDVAQPARASIGARAGRGCAHDGRRASSSRCARRSVRAWRWCRYACDAGARITATAFGVVLAVSLAGPLYLRGVGDAASPTASTRAAVQIAPAQSSARVAMILLDGASLDFIAPNAAGGRFPHFGRLLDSGAVMHLATLRPTQPAPVWTAVATGKLPYKNGVYSAARYVVPGSDEPLDLLPDFCFAQALVRLGLIEEVDRTSDAVRARPIWELLSSYGISAGVIGWPLTYPAHGVNGYLISDEFLQRDAASVIASLKDEPPLASPPEALDEARVARMQPRGRADPDRVRGPAIRDAAARGAGCAVQRARRRRCGRPARAGLRRECGRCSSRPFDTRASTRSATTTFATPSLARSATSPTKSGSSTAACSSSTTPTWTASSVEPWRPSAPMTCCWSCPDSGWSR